MRHPRDDKGNLITTPRLTEAPDFERLFRDSYRKLGWSAEEIDRAWAAKEARAKARARKDDSRAEPPVAGRMGAGEALRRAGKVRPSPPAHDPLED